MSDSPTITWKIANLERETQDGFVYQAHYTVDAVTEDGAYRSGAYGSVSFQRPENLIPFSELSEELVVQWVLDALGTEKVAEISAALIAQLDEQRHPTKAAGLPWAN
jgi:hypothetical protein